MFIPKNKILALNYITASNSLVGKLNFQARDRVPSSVSVPRKIFQPSAINFNFHLLDVRVWLQL